MIKQIKSKFNNFLDASRTYVSPPVFFSAAIMVFAVIIFGAFWTKTAATLFNNLVKGIGKYFGWYYIVSVAFFLFFVTGILFSKYGKIRLGSDDSRPEFSRFTWFSMLFAAGMGMGLVFWGVAEPITHYMKPPLATGSTPAAIKESMHFTFFHWGLHPWAIYIVFGLGIAYFHFRKGLPLAPRSLLYPLIGERYKGIIGHSVDAFCTVGTLLGVATSLGLGAMQINSGLKSLVGIEYNTFTQVIIIALITMVATISTVTGVKKGIKYLSIANIFIAVIMLSFVFIFGPTLYQIKLFISSTGEYLQNIVQTSLWVDTRSGKSWQTNWTVFYWGWWISWSPFVGIFIARISKGRTIREFILTVLFVPTIVTFLWLSVFGGSALHIEIFGSGGIAAVVSKNVSMSLNILLSKLPFKIISQWVGLFLVIIFFITSSDSGSLVDDMVTSGGNPNPHPATRVFWGLSEGGAAIVLLLAGGLMALQAASISAGLPQSLLLIAACVSLIISFRKEKMDKD